MSSTPNILVIAKSPAHVREYDFKAGDVRRFDREAAVSLAHRRVAERGCRQQVRISGPATHEGRPLWLIQDI